MEKFEASSSKCSRLEIGNRDVRAKFQNLESGIEEFYLSSTLGIGKGGSSSQVRTLESEMEEFEQSSEAWNRE